VLVIEFWFKVEDLVWVLRFFTWSLDKLLALLSDKGSSWSLPVGVSMVVVEFWLKVEDLVWVPSPSCRCRLGIIISLSEGFLTTIFLFLFLSLYEI
jgi:hypothetical protein